MERRNMRRLLVVVMMLVMLFSAFMLTACGNATDDDESGAEQSFTFVVVYDDGSEDSFDITTEREMVGEALLDEELIEGEEGQYGLYVKTVNGITVDYDTDGKYWAFYVDGEYATSGVDTTPVEDGREYAFKVE